MYLLETAHSSFCSRRYCADEPCDCVFVGEDADDVGASFDLAVEAFERVGRMQLLAVLPEEAHVGEDVVLGLVHEGGEL